MNSWAERRARAIEAVKADQDHRLGGLRPVEVVRSRSRDCQRCSMPAGHGGMWCSDCSALLDRQIARMREVGRTLGEISEELGISKSVVDQRITRMRKPQ